MKNKLAILLLVVIAILVSVLLLFLMIGKKDFLACLEAGWSKYGKSSETMPTTPSPGDLKVETAESNININVQIANPASQNCLDRGGKLEGVGDENGQFNICIFNDDTRCEEWAYFYGQCQAGKNIIVFSPKSDSDASLPLKVSGQARVFENTFSYRLKDKTGKILASGIGMSDSADAGKFGNFDIVINALFGRPSATTVTLEVYEASAKDGLDANLVSIPLKFTLPEVTIFKEYFSNDRLDPAINCDQVFPVERIIVKTTGVGRAALEQLLAGPNNDEYQNGYRTNINTGVELNSLIIENGTAKADFNEALQNQIGGSCRVSAIQAQITQTLKQFPGVNDVIISIAGRTEDILQP